MANPTGLLSQSIQNIQDMSQHLSALQSLPANAVPIRASAITDLQNDATKIAAMQHEIQQFVAAALPLVQQAQQDVNNNTNISAAITAIQQVNTQAKTLQTDIVALSTYVSNSKADIINLSNQLNTINTQLNNQSITLNTQLQSAQQEADAIRSKEKYFLALGIFGLVGLAAAGIALAVEEGKVNGLLSQVSSLRAQITSIGVLIQAIGQMQADFQDIVNNVSNVKNAIDFTASDVSEVISDLNNAQGGYVKAKLYLQTTLTQLQTLSIDAS